MWHGVDVAYPPPSFHILTCRERGPVRFDSPNYPKPQRTTHKPMWASFPFFSAPHNPGQRSGVRFFGSGLRPSLFPGNDPPRPLALVLMRLCYTPNLHCLLSWSGYLSASSVVVAPSPPFAHCSCHSSTRLGNVLTPLLRWAISMQDTADDALSPRAQGVRACLASVRAFTHERGKERQGGVQSERAHIFSGQWMSCSSFIMLQGRGGAARAK